MRSKLRPYQQEALHQIITEFEKTSSQICVLPTGTGKTVLFCHLIKTLGIKTLVIAHTKELLSQCKNTLSRECEYVTNEIYNYKSKLDKQVTICSFQSCINKKNLTRFKEADFQLLIIDECHRSACTGYRKIINELNFDKKKLIGFTATPFRTDKQSLNEIFSTVSYEKDILSMIKDGYLVDFKGFSIKTNTNLTGIKKKLGDFATHALIPIIDTEERNSIIVNTWLKLCQNEKTIGFCVSISHAKNLCLLFKKFKINCEYISGKTPRRKREQVIEDFKKGKVTVLLNCNILSEGFDEPSVTCLLMARPTCSKGLYLQMIGRGSRLFPGKTHCNVLDFTDNYNKLFNLKNIISNNMDLKDGERLSEFEERVKSLCESGDIVILGGEVLPKKLIGTEFNGFTTVGVFCEIRTKQMHYILQHTCGSVFTVHCNQLKKPHQCLKCDIWSNGFNGHYCEKVEKILSNLTLYLIGNEGEKIIRKLHG